MPNSLKCKIKHLCHNGTITERERDRILKALEQEPKTGHWIVEAGDRETGYGGCTMCSECSGEGDTEMDYCPHCGAKMVDPKESEVEK